MLFSGSFFLTRIGCPVICTHWEDVDTVYGLKEDFTQLSPAEKEEVNQVEFATQITASLNIFLRNGKSSNTK